MTLTVGIGKCHNNDTDNDRWQNLAIFGSVSYNRDFDFINTCISEKTEYTSTAAWSSFYKEKTIKC